MPGRPRAFEQRRRTREFVRALGVLGSFEAAVASSSLDPRQLPKLLDDPHFAVLAAAVLTDRVRRAAA